MSPVTIHLSDLFSKSISARDAVKTVFDQNRNSGNDLVVDFSQIEFVTRSAADQFLNEKKLA
jgi:anti-anti-sigma regulatory factor